MKKMIWALVLIGLVGVGSAAAWRWWKLSQANALPTGIVSGNGRIESVQVDVAAKYGGRIKEILAREGDLVEEGQVLVKMDTSELEAELEKDKAKLAESQQAAAEVKTEITKDESQLNLADVEFKRTKSLFERKVVAREEYDRYRTRLETAKASLDGTKAKLNTANQSINAAAAQVKRTEATIADTTLKSPVKGRVLYRLAEPAEVVPLGGKVLTLDQPGRRLYGNVPPRARGRPGQDRGRRPHRARRPARIRRAGESQLRLARSPVHPEASRNAQRARQAHVSRQAPGAARAGAPLHRADQDRSPGHGLRAPRRHGRLARLPGTTLSSQALTAGIPMPTLTKPVASITDLTHRYGKARALDSVTAEIPSGCMVGLIGPDGVGKSTLMGIIAGAKKIQSGKVHVLGGDIADRRHRNAVCPLIAYMPQGLGKNLYFELSVFENIDFFAQLFGLSRAERRTRIDGLLKATGLDPFPNRPAGKLSGGMKQKVGLCSSLIHDPDLLLLDEPTTGVDPLSRQQFWTLVDNIRAGRPGMSVLVSTAYMDEADRFDWLIAMDAGRILATGTPEELKQRTGTDNLEETFVALLPEEKRGSGRRLTIPPRVQTDAEPAIVAKNLTRRFGKFTAVNAVNFTIERGEIFGFLGSNGCGKSTTMKMLTGLLPATEGEAMLFGKPVDPKNNDARMRVGYMSQAFSLYGELTVAQNLWIHARLYHLPPESRRSRIDELVQRFGLDSVRRRPPRIDPARRAPAAFAGGGDHPRPGDADPRRADVRCRPGGARRVLGAADRALAREAGHDLHLDPLHERGDALRPHLLDARGGRAGVRHPEGPDGRARDGRPGGGVHRLHRRRLE